ncbi:hypothetical protein [Alloactinosynnema sp. L-07]|nr:hypothetical protein [Alloactinosynnema sp. L-07]
MDNWHPGVDRPGIAALRWVGDPVIVVGRGVFARGNPLFIQHAKTSSGPHP